MENNKVYVGDTLQTLKKFPDNFFDITVTSPPYNKNKAKGKLVAEVKYKDATDSKSEPLYQLEQMDVLNEIFRVTKPHGHIFYNHKLRWVDGMMIHPMQWLSLTKWNMRQEIVWDRGIAANIRGWRFWQVEERIYWMQKGIVRGDELESRHAKMSSVWRIRPEGRFPEHPAPFPIEIPTRCIYSIADQRRELNVLDPYCGIGTTLVAANILNHNFVGIDCTEEYVYKTYARLNSKEDTAIIVEEIGRHCVEKSYAERKKLKLSKTC